MGHEITTSKSKILKDTSIVSMAAFTGIILGLVKNSLIARRYGTGAVYDAFLIAANLPAMITGFALNGAINFIPIFSAALKENTEEEAWKTASRMLSFWVSLILFFTMIFFVVAPIMIRVLAPGFGAAERELARHIAYVILWAGIFAGFSALANLISYTSQQFTIPSLSGIVNNVVIIAVLVGFVQQRIEILAVATVLGAASQLFINYKALGKVRRYFKFKLELTHPVIRRVVKLSIPQYVGQGGVVLSTVIDRGFASILSDGAVSAISYSLMLVEMPITVFISAISQVYFPLFSRHADEPEYFQEDFQSSVRMMMLIIFPISVGLISLGVPIIRLLFERGAFTAESTAMTYAALGFLSAGLLGEGLNAIYSNAYFAKQDTVVPMVAGLARVATVIALNFLLVYRYGISGLAISTSLSIYVKFLIFDFFCKRRIGLDPRTVWKGNFVKVAMSSLTMGVVVYLFSQFMGDHFPPTGITNKSIVVGACLALGGVVYLGMLFLLGVKEVSRAYSFVTQRINVRRFISGNE